MRYIRIEGNTVYVYMTQAGLVPAQQLTGSRVVAHLGGTMVIIPLPVSQEIELRTVRVFVVTKQGEDIIIEESGEIKIPMI